LVRALPEHCVYSVALGEARKRDIISWLLKLKTTNFQPFCLSGFQIFFLGTNFCRGVLSCLSYTHINKVDIMASIIDSL